MSLALLLLVLRRLALLMHVKNFVESRTRLGSGVSSLSFPASRFQVYFNFILKTLNYENPKLNLQLADLAILKASYMRGPQIPLGDFGLKVASFSWPAWMLSIMDALETRTTHFLISVALGKEKRRFACFSAHGNAVNYRLKSLFTT